MIPDKSCPSCGGLLTSDEWVIEAKIHYGEDRECPSCGYKSVWTYNARRVGAEIMGSTIMRSSAIEGDNMLDILKGMDGDDH